MEHKPAVRIAVVDDTESNRYTVAHYLKRAGFEVWEAATGKQGLELARKGPDLIVLDIKLPDIIGYDLSQMIKTDPATRGIPILQISATYINAESRVQSLEAGADAYLTWPFDADELIANVKALLRLSRAERQAQESADRLQWILSTIADSYFVLDSQFRFVQVNRVASESYFKRSEQELVGSAYLEMFSHAEPSDLYREMRRAFAGGVPVHSEVHSSINSRWYEAHIYPREEQLEVYLRDITERKVAEEELARAQAELETHARTLEEAVAQRTAQLEQSNKELEAFSYSVSHDLRAPLRAISGYATIVQKRTTELLPADDQRYLQLVVDSAAQMGRLVDGLLNFSRLGRKEMDRLPVDMRMLFEKAIAEYMELYSPNGRDYDIKVAPDLPPSLGDPTLVRQVVVNLISNAFKFSGKNDRVEIYVGWSQSNSGSGFNLYFVRDNGVGFDMRHADKLFGVFQRLHARQDFEGTGIGLAFSKRIIERHGGMIKAEGEVGKGATVSFTLPSLARVGEPLWEQR